MFPKLKRQVDRALLDRYHGMRCAACGRKGCDPAHIKSRGSGGDDAEWNLMPLCREHHSEQHSRGWWAFGEKYPGVWLGLKTRGWGWDGRRLVREEGQAVE
jgi:5-methylcytosine-specific restriction endonuclease McrA